MISQLSHEIFMACSFLFKTGWCSTLTLLLICSSFSRENVHLLLICSSLSTTQKMVFFPPWLLGREKTFMNFGEEKPKLNSELDLARGATVDGSEIWQTHQLRLVVYLSHYLHGVFYIISVVVWGFLNHQQ